MTHLFPQFTFATVRAWLSSSILATAIATAASPLMAVAAEPVPDKPADSAQALSNMFSKEIRDTLNACVESGGVNLSQGAAKDGSVQCKENKKKTKIAYNTYLSTFSDFVSAGFLVGFRAALKDDPQAQQNASAIQELFKSEAGEGLLKQVLTSALANTQAISSDSPDSLNILVAEVLKRTQPILKDATALSNLLGSDAEYKQIVEQFCTIPGMSVQKAQTAIPGISSIQLYASCIQASGLAKDMAPSSVSPTPTPPGNDPIQPSDPAKMTPESASPSPAAPSTNPSQPGEPAKP